MKELERLASATKATDSSSPHYSANTITDPAGSSSSDPCPDPAPDASPAPNQGWDLIDPSLLHVHSSSPSSPSFSQHISPANFLQVSGFSFLPDTDVFFDCGCSTLHIPAPASPFLLPSRPRAFSLHANTLRLEVECTLSALLKNCLHLGIPKGQFCADESVSLFYRPLLPPVSEADGGSLDNEASKLVSNTLALFRTVKHDLRPSTSQITESHHPYIDVLPFRDLRDNLVVMQGRIDEDEFLHDWLNQATCWGGIRGSRGSGTPWDGRSWEVSEDFLSKWEVITGGSEGELARGSRWWRATRGETVEEVM